MALDTLIKVRHIFQSYPIFYQPYIPPVMDVLRVHPELDFGIQVFQGSADQFVHKMPNYYYRRVFEKTYQIIKKPTYPLNYLEWLLLQQDVHIIHVQDSFLFKKVIGLLHMDASKRPKIVITLRGNDTYVKPWIQNEWKDFYKNCGHQVDAFVVMSTHQKNYLHTNWGIALDTIYVIPISFGNEQAVVPKSVDGSVLKIVSAFRMCWEKNIAGNLQVIRALKARQVPVHYDIYGDGPDAGQVPFLIEQYGLQDRVTYHGSVSNAVLKTHLHTAHIFLQLSHSDALPTSVLEAQALGLPAIVSNSGGLPESIIPNTSGYVVQTSDVEQAADYILELWGDAEKYAHFSEAAIRHAQTNFSVTNEVDRLLALYKTLID
ncbi:glycosyltransferase family 4 protein [Bizionia hallyeonensis]|uniref:Glycosyltransferase family 4 protein n=1 Tax=Bizionia hallyeonensis TaxID=1123757 RepID=A0ABW0C5H4_9FLAO